MEGSLMIKIRNLTAITTIFLMLAFIGCGGGGSSSSDDNTPVPEGTIYSAAGDWTINAVYTGDPNNQCSQFLGPSDVVTIKESGNTFTITFINYDISVTGTRQGNTLTYNGPVSIGTTQVGTADGTINITSDTTFDGTLTVNSTYPEFNCQALYNVTGNKNPSD
jgi:hypothetical protein